MVDSDASPASTGALAYSSSARRWAASSVSRDDRLGEEEHLAVVRIAALLLHPGLERVVVLLHLVHRLPGDDDGLGVAGGEVLPAVRRARLDDDGAPLRRRRGVEGPARAVVRALEVDRPHLRGIGEGVGARVHDDRVRIPARPEPVAQLHVLVGPVVALVVIEQLLVPEVQRLLDLVGRHHVPRDAPAAQVVERGHEAGEQERRIERRRQRGREADPPRRRRHDGDEGARVVKGRVLGIAEIGVHPPLVGPRHGEAVPEHDQVELGALERHRHVLPELRPRPLVARSSADPPSRRGRTPRGG